MYKYGKLYIIATPIGNLEDITLRALRVLKEVDLILCEDTRVTKKLLDRYEIKKPLLSYHHHSRLSRVEKIIEHLENGKNLALVSDAGTPGVSDPGNELVAQLIKSFSPQMRGDLPELLRESKQAGVPKGQRGADLDNTSPLIPSSTEEGRIKIVPIPGASAITAMASVAGMNMNKFCFMGFPPHKKGRMTFIADIMKSIYPVIIYESKYRILKLLDELGGLGGYKQMRLIVGREMTKQFEEIIRGDIDEVRQYFSENRQKVLGEFTIIVHKEQ